MRDVPVVAGIAHGGVPQQPAILRERGRRVDVVHGTVLAWGNHLPFGNDFGLNNAKPYDIIPSGKEKYGEIEVSCRNRRKAKNCP